MCDIDPTPAGAAVVAVNVCALGVLGVLGVPGVLVEVLGGVPGVPGVPCVLNALGVLGDGGALLRAWSTNIFARDGAFLFGFSLLSVVFVFFPYNALDI